jgi:hypothetical protein
MPVVGGVPVAVVQVVDVVAVLDRVVAAAFAVHVVVRGMFGVAGGLAFVPVPVVLTVQVAVVGVVDVVTVIDLDVAAARSVDMLVLGVL